jgi:hypothetical protein
MEKHLQEDWISRFDGKMSSRAKNKIKRVSELDEESHELVQLLRLL